MKIKRLFATGLFVAILSLTAPMAHAVLITTASDEYIGVIATDKNPTNSAAILPLLNYLLDQAQNSIVVYDGDTYTRSNNECADVLCPDASGDGSSQGGGGNEYKAVGSNYFIQKYGSSFFHVWDITDVVGTGDGGKVLKTDLNTPDSIFEQTRNNWNAFLASSPEPCTVNCPPEPCTENCPQPVPEPGTLGLLGLGLLGLAARRRRTV